MNNLEVIKIEILCEPYYNSWDPGACLLPVGKYKLFFIDGSVMEQDYIYKSDLNSCPIQEKVTSFTKEFPYCSINVNRSLLEFAKRKAEKRKNDRDKKA